MTRNQMDEVVMLAVLHSRCEQLRKRGITIGREEGLAAMQEFERTGDPTLIRKLVEEAEQRATLLHSLECACAICAGRTKQ